MFKKDIEPTIPSISVGDTIQIVLFLEWLNPGDTSQKKKRTQLYKGVVISKRSNLKITVRKMFQGVGIEKVFLLDSPWIKSFKILSRAKVRRSKLYYLRDRVGKLARLKPKN